MNNKNTVSKPAPSPNAFWIGLPFMMFFVIVGIGGATWTLNRILLERVLYNEGVVAPGIVLNKEVFSSTKRAGDGVTKTTYTVSYRFNVNSRGITNETRVEGDIFYPLKNGGAIDIRYLPDNPDKNLPDGTHLTGIYIFFSIFGYLVGLGALVVVIGMIVDKVRK